MKIFSKDQILSALKIVDIAEENGIPLEPVSSGNFTHRCKCPGTDHKSGSERTGSLYIDSIRNNFYCFGCSASNNAIDFYMLCTDTDFGGAIREISETIDPEKVSKAKSVHVQNNFSKLLEISNLFRRYQKRYPNDTEWIESLMLKADSYMEKIDRTDVHGAVSLLRNISRILNRRYS